MFQRSTCVALWFGIVLTLASTAAVAQSAPINATDLTISNQITVNQCSAGEPVALNGTLHVEYLVSTDPDTGANLFSVSASNNLSGVGQTSGVQYAAADSADYTISSSQPSADATVQLKADLVPQGTGTAMTLIQQIHITLDTSGNLTVQIVGNTSSCGS